MKTLLIKGSQDKTSHPVGTTVRVANFLNLFPVRKQTALKNSAKSLAKIKQTLQAYAIARPSTRLSFKVLKAKNEKGNWVYAPKAGASVADAAMKVVDKTSAGQCHWVTWCSPEFDPSQTDAVTDIEESGAGHLVKSSYKIEAFLPRPAAGEYYQTMTLAFVLIHVDRCFGHQSCGSLRLHRLEASFMCPWNFEATDYDV